MRVLFTGGGSGGHFYPIIAIAEELNKLADEKRLVGLELFYISPTPYDRNLLFENNIVYKRNSAGKIRRYFSFLNFFDLFQTIWGIAISVYQVYKLYPDVIFGKGGYASFPVMVAARLLRIPTVIHESDTVPGRVNLWAGKWADRIAISYAEAGKYFPEDKTALTGNPIRSDIATPIVAGAREFLKIEDDIPVVLVLGGSLGAAKINDVILGGLEKLVEHYVVIHQTGMSNFAEVKITAEAILSNSSYKDRYKPFDYLGSLALRMAAGAATVVISRAGSTLFEIAAWGLPSIVIPITDSNGDHQRQNAFAYARAGACSVIEEINLSPNILLSELNRIVNDKAVREKMIESAKSFYKPNAARKVAEEILKIALAHEIER